MYINLEKYKNAALSEVLQGFLDDGLELIEQKNNTLIFSYPGDDKIIKATSFANQAEAFACICKSNKDNPYFPEIFQTFKSDAHSPVFITVEEKLHKLEEIPKQVRGIFGGFARAMALVLERDSRHKDLSKHFMSNSAFASAIYSIIGELKSSLKSEDMSCLFYQRGKIAPNQSIDDWYPDTMCFRAIENGKKWVPVFTDPFFEGYLKGQDRKDYMDELDTLESVLKENTNKKKGPEANAQGHSFR